MNVGALLSLENDVEIIELDKKKIGNTGLISKTDVLEVDADNFQDFC